VSSQGCSLARGRRIQIFVSSQAKATWFFTSSHENRRSTIFAVIAVVHPFSRPRLDPSRWAFNVRCIDGVDLSSIEIRPFDGANWEVAAKAYLERPK